MAEQLYKLTRGELFDNHIGGVDCSPLPVVEMVAFLTSRELARKLGELINREFAYEQARMTPSQQFIRRMQVQAVDLRGVERAVLLRAVEDADELPPVDPGGDDATRQVAEPRHDELSGPSELEFFAGPS